LTRLAKPQYNTHIDTKEQTMEAFKTWEEM